MDDDDDTPPPQPLLLLISHSRTHPLRTPPDLKFDVRSVANPPKQIRDKYTGVDKRLREHMLSHGDFVLLLDRAEGEIKALMRKMTVGAPEEGIPALKEWRAAATGGKGRVVRNVQQRGAVDGVEEDEVEDGSGEDEDVEDEDRPMLRVGVFCVRGRHRSVAFAEELALREWPKEWEVRVVHRDLARSRKDAGGRRPDRRNSSFGRGFLDDEDE
jgi:RNase adaptor protein for sRNA GlmZ degradation